MTPGSHNNDRKTINVNVAPGSLGAIIRSYKSAVARRVKRRLRTSGAPTWQRGYYERIIRDAREHAAVRRYIIANPARHASHLGALLRRLERKGNP